jgi:hypothetical protein
MWCKSGHGIAWNGIESGASTCKHGTWHVLHAGASTGASQLVIVISTVSAWPLCNARLATIPDCFTRLAERGFCVSGAAPLALPHTCCTPVAFDRLHRPMPTAGIHMQNGRFLLLPPELRQHMLDTSQARTAPISIADLQHGGGGIRQQSSFSMQPPQSGRIMDTAGAVLAAACGAACVSSRMQLFQPTQ